MGSWCTLTAAAFHAIPNSCQVISSTCQVSKIGLLDSWEVVRRLGQRLSCTCGSRVATYMSAGHRFGIEQRIIRRKPPSAFGPWVLATIQAKTVNRAFLEGKKEQLKGS